MADGDGDWRAYVRELLYPILFTEQPLAEVGRVIEQLFTPGGREPAVYADAVARALASDERIADLNAVDLPEAEVRAFLRALAGRLHEIPR
jgi:hypothetical protein